MTEINAALELKSEADTNEEMTAMEELQKMVEKMIRNPNGEEVYFGSMRD